MNLARRRLYCAKKLSMKFYISLLLFLSCSTLFSQIDPPIPIEFPEVKDDIQLFPDVEASFPGGDSLMLEFIYTNLKYPEYAKDYNIQGKVFIQFVVEIDGSLSHFDVLRTPHQVLSDESKRILLLMPKWNPAEQLGKKVRSRYTLPIAFKLNP